MTSDLASPGEATWLPARKVTAGLWRRFEGALGLLRARILLAGCERGRGIYAGAHLRVVRQGALSVGDRVIFRDGMIASELVCWDGGTLSIGAESIFNYGVSIEAWEQVRIGRRCMFASMVRISDRGVRGKGPVVMGDDVWVAHGAVIEPGVTIGAGSVISAGSVVTQDVPAHALAIGNPARCMGLNVLTGNP